VIAQIEAGEITRGDVVLVGRDQRRVERIDRCKSSRTDLHIVWQRGNVPLCIRPEAVVDVFHEPLITKQHIVTFTANIESFKTAVALAAQAFDESFERVKQTIAGTKEDTPWHASSE